MSISRSAASITAGSCSTTTRVLPASRRRCIASDDPVHVARMQADRRLVEHEQGVDERGAERGRQVDALHLAAGERAALAVEREVADADVAEVAQPRADLVVEELPARRGRRRAPRPASSRSKKARSRSIGSSIRSCTVRPGSASSCSRLQADADRHEALRRRQHRVGVVLRADPPEQRLELQPRAAAGRARRVAAVLREQHPDVHLVRLRLEVAEEAADAVPLLVPLALPVRRALDHPVALRLGELLPGGVARDAGLAGVLEQVVLDLGPGRRLDRLDRAVAQRLAVVGNDEAEVDADHPAEAAAGLARAVGRVEREQRRLRLGVAQVAVGAVQAGREAPDAARPRASPA